MTTEVMNLTAFYYDKHLHQLYSLLKLHVQGTYLL